jgi:phosphohistidine phosphatase
MRLFIVRHAIAEERGKKFYPRDDRPLTKDGIKKMKANAEGMRLFLPSSFTVVTSPLKRAFATAEIIASQNSDRAVIAPDDALLPEDKPQDIIQVLKKYENHPTVVLVGHEPSLGKFLSFVLQQKSGSILIKKGSVICIDYSTEQPNRSTLLFIIPPKILRMIGKKR